MTTAPKISVLLSVCNDERFLRFALDSILAQTLPDFELIVVDDASTDCSPDILVQYGEQDARIRILQAPSRQGLTRSLNQALAAAQGEFIARMDSDDLCTAERFERQWTFLKEHPEIGVLGCGFEKIDEEGHCFGIQDTLPQQDSDIRLFLKEGNNPFCHGSVMIRRSILQTLKGYREAFSTTQDFDLWLRIPTSVKMANLSAILYSHRRHHGSISRQRFLLQRQLKHMALALHQEREIEQESRSHIGAKGLILDSLDRQPNTKSQQNWVQQFLKTDLQAHRHEYAYLLYKAGKRRLKRKDAQQARQWLKDALQLNPLLVKAWFVWLQTFFCR
jgi:glycosyltransferase involved in cell wall biosynthesis